MSEFDIAKKRRTMETDIACYRWRINGHLQEIDVMRDRIDRLQQRLVTLAEFERALPPKLDDLLRMCNTPCWRYRPRGS